MQVLSISLVFEILSLLTAVICYLQKGNGLIRLFIPFLLLTVIVELLGRWAIYPKGLGKYGLYNLFTAVEFIFYGFVFFINLENKYFKQIVLFFLPFFTIAALLNLLFIQGLNKTFNSYTLVFGSFFIVIFCCFYFYESVSTDKIDLRLSRQPFFWISSGLLIFYLGSVIINALFQYLSSTEFKLEGIKIYTIINRSLNVILYTFFSIAFFLCPNNKKTSLLQS